MSVLYWRNWRTKQRAGEPTEPLPLAGLRHEVGKLLDAFVREPLEAVDWPFRAEGKWTPPIEFTESDEAVTVRMELPGVDPNGIDVTVAGGRLIIAGEKPQPVRPKASELCRGEIRYGAFRRSVHFPEDVDVDRIEANYQQGVLTLRLPKQQAGGTQKVHIKVSAEEEATGEHEEHSKE